MNASIFQERLSKIQMFENSLNILSNESMVKKPYPSIKTLFYNKMPKNRKNLKKLKSNMATHNIHNNKDRLKNYLSKYKTPSIQSIINNSKTSEFLSLDHPINKYRANIFPSQTISNINSSSRINTLNNNNGINHSINNGNNIMKIKSQEINHSMSIQEKMPNFSNNNKMRNSINYNNVLKSKKISKMSNADNINKSNDEPVLNKKEVDLNDLYKEYIDNVSNIIFIILF